MEENYQTIRKSQLEIYLSQFGEFTTEQRKQKIFEFFSDDTPGLSKARLQQNTLNKLEQVGDIRENIMKHHEIYKRYSESVPLPLMMNSTSAAKFFSPWTLSPLFIMKTIS